jgi:catalase
MVLDRNPANFFAEVEQAGFSPANLVPGIGLSPDKMLMGRIFSYHDTHLHRIGANYEQLPVNAPKVDVHSYNKDGHMTYHHSGAQPVYAPNSYGGPMADPVGAADVTWSVEGAEIGRYANAKHAEDDDFGQPRTLYNDVMSDVDRDHLVDNIVGHASDAVATSTQERVVAYWSAVDADLGARVASGLGINTREGRFTRSRDIVAEHANRA